VRDGFDWLPRKRDELSIIKHKADGGIPAGAEIIMTPKRLT
jgi:hypothetical protein